MAQSEEETRLQAIKRQVIQSRLEFRSNERNPDCFLSGRRYLYILNQAVEDLSAWETDVQNKTEQVEIPGTGRPRVTFPKRDDPSFKLLADAIPFIIEVRQERDELQGWLEVNDPEAATQE